MDELPGGLYRVTMPLPMRPGHVHCYLVPVDDGYVIVDTGLGLPDATERWETELAELDGDVVGIFLTHFHPDHLGAAADLRALTRAPVHQGRVDAAQADLAWSSDGWSAVLVDWFQANGAPEPVTRELVDQGSRYLPFIRTVPDPTLVDDGAMLGEWELVAAPGHADGQLTLLRDGTLIAADHLLGPDHADRRVVAREPARSARRLSRCARANDRAGPDDRLRRARRPDRRSGRDELTS